MTDDHDLRLVASFRDDTDAPSPQRLASMRAEFLKGRTVTRKTFFTPKRLGLIGGPVVAAIAVGAFALAGPGNPTAAPGPDTSVTQEALAPNADARTVLAYFAMKAATGEATTLQPGQYILEHVQGTGFKELTTTLSPFEWRTWNDPFRQMADKKESGLADDGSPYANVFPDEALPALTFLDPSPAYLDALTGDPAAIAEQWRAEWLAAIRWDHDGQRGTGPLRLTPGTPEFLAERDYQDGQIFRFTAKNLLTLAQTAATPAKRALIWAALAELKGVTRTDGTVTDYLGRVGVALGIEFTATGARWELILDPETSRVLGDRTLKDGSVPNQSSIEIKVVNSLDEQ
ncbi:hypothetical protein Afil01_21030 [Actinorhabdospora filicis]|uniref:CU044_5270 family protein n=1 Tax=Actinorhabdospora filicis TaxID=1785913 RepID=A0A9W6SKC7_9ACTN|nr:hypothetical protein [Actinorhabdospora filicis]GLZ77296.1 hypothetical protein Afil01_21030 [Actinorhabdospora filicis]